jgi:hypothetical protein
MNGEVSINEMRINGDMVNIKFFVTSLNIDSQYNMDKQEYLKTLNDGGFNGLGKYLLEQLDSGIQALLKE